MQTNHTHLALALAGLSLVVLGCSKNGDHQHGDHPHEPANEGSATAKSGANNGSAKVPAAEPTKAPKPDEPDLLQLELDAHAAAKPILDEACASCHTTALAKSKKAKKGLKHFVMDSYPYGGHHKAELGKSIRKVLGLEGKKATMPKDDPGSIQGPELERIDSWTTAWDAAAAAGLGHHAKPAHDGHSDHKH